MFFDEVELRSFWTLFVSSFVSPFPTPQDSFLAHLFFLLYTHFSLGFVWFNQLSLYMNYLSDIMPGTRIQAQVNKTESSPCEDNSWMNKI